MTGDQRFPVHGGQLATLARQHGLDASRLLDFSANINPDGPPAIVVEALRAALTRSSSLIEYPDLQHFALKQAIAQRTAAAAHEISIANGFVPLLEAVIRALPIRTCLVPMPCFHEYRPALERQRIQVLPHPLSAGAGFHYDMDHIIQCECDAILLANPQNPSGTIARLEHMHHLVEAAAARNKYILLDEAFIDYAAEHSLSHSVSRYPNLIVFRSFTKFYAIPAMRVAYCVASADIVERMERNLPPWPVSTLASIAVQAALSDEPYSVRARQVNDKRRVRLFRALVDLHLHPLDGAANFLLFRLPARIGPAQFWRSMFMEHGIVLRSCENYEHLPTGYLRTVVRSEDDNERLIGALTVLISR